MSITRIGFGATPSRNNAVTNKSVRSSDQITMLGTMAVLSANRVINNKPTRENIEVTYLSFTATPSEIKEFLQKNGSSNFLGGYYFILKHLSKKG